MTYYIGSARHDERGKYSGGKAGDQTGQEVATQEMYNHRKGWVCFRPKKPELANALKQMMLMACGNPHIGYSQADRYGVVRFGIKAKKNINCDCSTLVRECIKEASGKDLGDFSTLTEKDVLEKSGMFERIGRVHTWSILYDGDVLVTGIKGHTAIVTSGHERPVSKTTTATKSLVEKGIEYANSFTGHTSTSDPSESKKQRVRVLQHALNLDYKAGLTEDGVYGKKTEKALGRHYVEYGETQYMVTAAEILYYMLGTDPKGVEVPGTFGKGLKKAAGKSKITWQDFKSLL